MEEVIYKLQQFCGYLKDHLHNNCLMIKRMIID